MKKRHSPEQIVRKLRQAEAKLTSGTSISGVAKELSGTARRSSTAGATVMAE